MKLLILLSLLTLIGCETPRDTKERLSKEYPEFQFPESIPVGDGYWRSENKEVICYQLFQGSIQCKFKESK